MKIQYQDSSLIIFESSLFRTTTTLIVDNDYILLVDPNWLPIELDFIQSWIAKNTDAADQFLLFTHSDYDHIIGYGNFKSYKTIASQNFVKNKSVSSILDQINAFDDDNYITREHTIEYPKIDLVIKGHPDSISLGGDDYVFFQAPGHNDDGIITFNKSKGILIVGDYLSNIEFPYVYSSFAKYEETLKVLESLIAKHDVKILISGHGDYTSSKSEMQLRIQESRKYISDLFDHVKNGESFNFDQLFTRYHFPIVMKKFHDKNVALIKKELGA